VGKGARRGLGEEAGKRAHPWNTRKGCKDENGRPGSSGSRRIFDPPGGGTRKVQVSLVVVVHIELQIGKNKTRKDEGKNSRKKKGSNGLGPQGKRSDCLLDLRKRTRYAVGWGGDKGNPEGG